MRVMGLCFHGMDLLIGVDVVVDGLPSFVWFLRVA